MKTGGYSQNDYKTECEGFVISALLNDAECFDLAHRAQIDRSVFTCEDYKVLFDVLSEMYQSKMPVTYFTVTDFLKTKSLKKGVNLSMERLQEISNLIPSTATFQQHLQEIYQAYMRREGFGDIEKRLTDYEKALDRLRIIKGEPAASEIGFVDAEQGELREVEEIFYQEFVLANSYNVIVGNEQTGKSSLACYFAAKRLDDGQQVFYFNFEDSEAVYREKIKLALRDKARLKNLVIYTDNEFSLNMSILQTILKRFDLIVIDTLAALCSDLGIDYIKSDKTRTLTNMFARSKKTILAINHLTKQGVEAGSQQLIVSARSRYLAQRSGSAFVLENSKDSYNKAIKSFKYFFKNDKIIIDVNEDEVIQRVDENSLPIEVARLFITEEVSNLAPGKKIYSKELKNKFQNNFGFSAATLNRALKELGFKSKRSQGGDGSWYWEQ